MLKILAIATLLTALVALLAAYAFIWFSSWQGGMAITAVVALCYGVQWATEYLASDD